MKSQQDSNIDVAVNGDCFSATVSGRITFHTPVGQFTTNKLEIKWQTGKPPVCTIDGAPVFDIDANDYVWRKLSIEGDDFLKAIYRLALVPSEIATIHSLTESVLSTISTQGERTNDD